MTETACCLLHLCFPANNGEYDRNSLLSIASLLSCYNREYDRNSLLSIASVLSCYNREYDRNSLLSIASVLSSQKQRVVALMQFLCYCLPVLPLKTPNYNQAVCFLLFACFPPENKQRLQVLLKTKSVAMRHSPAFCISGLLLRHRECLDEAISYLLYARSPA